MQRWQQHESGGAGRGARCLGGLGGGGLLPSILASWLVLKHWLKIALIVWELLLQRSWLWPPRDQGRRGGCLLPLESSSFGSSAQLATAVPIAYQWRRLAGLFQTVSY